MKKHNKKTISIAASILLSLPAFTSIRAQAPDGSWEQIGTIRFTALARQSATTITASTANGYIYYSHDYCSTWIHRIISDTADLMDIAWADSLHGAVIEEYNNVYLTSDGGSTWTRSSLPVTSLTPPVAPLSKLAYPQADTLYTCDLLGRVFRTTDRGRDWASYQTPVIYGLTSIYFIDAKNGFVGGANTDLNSDSSFFRTTDAGVHWSSVLLPVAADSLGPRCMDFKGRDTGIIGAWGYYWTTIDGGGLDVPRGSCERARSVIRYQDYERLGNFRIRAGEPVLLFK